MSKGSGKMESFDFQGCFAPRILFELLEAKQITPTEMAVYLVVNAYQQRGRVCYLTNESLGSRTGLSERQARACLEKLENVNLIERSTEIVDGRLLRIIRVLPDTGMGFPAKTAPAPRQATATPPAVNRHPPGGKPPPPSPTIPDRYKDKSNTAAPLRGPRRTPSAIPEWALHVADLLASAIGRVHGVNQSAHRFKWGAAIAKLHTEDKVEQGRIRDTMRWYTEQLKERHSEPFFPQINNGLQFRDRFPRLCALRKAEAADAEESGGDGTGDSSAPVEMKMTTSRPLSPEESRAHLEAMEAEQDRIYAELARKR